MLNAPLARFRGLARADINGNVTNERKTVLFCCSRDREVRYTGQPRVHFNEVHALLVKHVHSFPRLLLTSNRQGFWPELVWGHPQVCPPRECGGQERCHWRLLYASSVFRRRAKGFPCHGY